MLEFIALPYSPWSEKARWALDHHRIAYAERVYSPIFGEPGLRLRIRRLRGKITVPMLVEGRNIIGDSLDIARYADRHGQAEPLIPMGQEEEVSRWNARCETALASGRALLIHNIRGNREAKLEYVPGFIPKPMRRLLAPPVAAMGLGYFIRKYDLSKKPPEDHLSTIRACLQLVSEALPGGRQTILDGFSFADIAMATVFQFVEPLDNSRIRLGRASRPCWANPSLAEEFPHLLQWRDELYQNFRDKPQDRIAAAG